MWESGLRKSPVNCHCFEKQGRALPGFQTEPPYTDRVLVAALRPGDRARAGWAAVGLQGAPGSRKPAALGMRVQEYKPGRPPASSSCSETHTAAVLGFRIARGYFVNEGADLSS